MPTIVAQDMPLTPQFSPENRPGKGFGHRDSRSCENGEAKLGLSHWKYTIPRNQAFAARNDSNGLRPETCRFAWRNIPFVFFGRLGELKVGAKKGAQKAQPSPWNR
jgi:hypothetical protein